MLKLNPLPRVLEIDDVLAFEWFEGFYVPILDVSPDKRRVAVSVTSGLENRRWSARPYLWGIDRGRLHIIDIESGSVRLVAGPDGAGLMSPFWSPDGRRIAAIAAHHDWVRLCVITPESGSIETIADRDLLLDFERPRPFQWIDDDTIAVFLVPPGRRAAGIEIASATIDAAPAAWTAMQVGKRPTADRLTIKQRASKCPAHELALVSLTSRTVSSVTKSCTDPILATFASAEPSPIEYAAIGLAMRAADRCLWHDEATSESISIVRGNTGTELLWTDDSQVPRTLLRINTHLNDVRVGRAFELQYRLPTGRFTTMRCVLPPDWQEGEPRPTVMFVYPTVDRAAHPSNPPLVEGPNIIYNAHLFAALGYVVLEPNLPFERSADEHLIDAVVKGVECALDAAEESGLVDRTCVHVFGQSAGGWAAMALLAKTSHFRSGISLAGVSDLVSLYTQLDPRWRYHGSEHGDFQFAEMCEKFFCMPGPPWQDTTPYLHGSPLFLADKIQAPLLLMHGDLDYVSIAQSESMFAALARQGKSVEFVRYWGEDHVYASAANVRDAFSRITTWLEQHSASEGH